ncbi:MAG: hypothetical protein ACK5LC_08885 [Coprobacillaceae bacterium]
MKIKCICGNIMHDENLETCEVYSTYNDEEYYQLLENNPKTVAEMVDKMPSSGGFWKCKRCGRLYFLKDKKLEVYSLEKEILD